MSSESSGSSSTIATYSPKIAEIRETSAAEAANGKTVYIKRQDGREESISSVWEFSAYSMDMGDSILQRERTADFWKAYNTIARFILSGKIRLSGGRDCFKRLANPPTGVRTLTAGDGIFFKPDEKLNTFGTIYARAPNDKVTKAHITSPIYNNRGQSVNRIVLSKGVFYLIAGDDSDPGGRAGIDWEVIICHRGRLREAGFEIPGPIERKDLWLLDSAGSWKGSQPLAGRRICSRCIQSYANRKWPMIDVCEGNDRCDNAISNSADLEANRAGYRPAWAEAECAASLVRTYRGGRMIYGRRYVRNVAKVLDASFTVRDWDHLSEMTGYSHALLALLFCSVPSLGERLNKKEASFVPWARESGISLGDYLRIDVRALKALYVILEGAVMDKHTGLKVKFEEDDKGVIHVEQGSQDFSKSFPEGVSGYVRLG